MSDFPDLNAQADLPPPELTDADEIVEAMYEPGLEDQAVVSMLYQLGIAIYAEDGTLLQAGSDQSDADFYVFEPEVRGLIAMLASQGAQPWIDFTDFHAGLAGFGLQSSADELAQAYNDAYAAAPDEPITKFVQANAFIATEAQLSPLGVWLMLLDGMIPPNPSSLAIASTGPFVAANRASWGVAAPNVQAQNWSSNLNNAISQTARSLAAQAMAQTAQVAIETTPNRVHEGHGGSTGAPATISAFVRPCGAGGSRSCSMPAGSSLAGITVTWQFDGTLTGHGSPSISSGTSTAVDASGTTQFTYTPQPETPDAHVNGYLTHAVSTITASVSRSEIIQRIYNLPAAAALFLGGGSNATYSANFVIEWHEPNALRVELVNPYDVKIIEALVGGDTHQWGTDTISGDLILDEDGVTYRGIMVGKANGHWTGKAFGKACSTSWNTSQLLQVEAVVHENLNIIRFTFHAVDAPSGQTARGRCRPTQWKDALTGVYFAPYNDYAITPPGYLEFVMFPKPGGDASYPVPPAPFPNWVVKNTLWHVHMEYLEPRP